jgi:hypothetical protein
VTDKIRKSLLNNYKLCQLNCKAIWVDKMVQPANMMMKTGTKFHKQAPEFYKELKWDTMISLTVPELRSYFATHWPTPSNPEEEVLAKNFIDHQMYRFQVVKNCGQEYFFPLETEFTIDTPSFHGTIDAIFKYDQEYNCVHEWKTGNSFDITSLRGELAFYCTIGNATKYKGTLKYISCFGVYINKFFIDQLHHQSVTAMRKWLEKFNESKRTNIWKRNMGIWCRSCPVNRECLLEFVPYGDVFAE